MRSGHVQGLQVSKGLDGRLSSCCCLIFVSRCDQNNNSKRNLWKPRTRVKLALYPYHSTLHTHALFSPCITGNCQSDFKGFHFTLSKYQERKMILLSQHFYLDFHLSWGGSPLKYYQVKTNSERLHLETEQSSCLDRGDPKLPRCWGPLENTKITSGHLYSLAEPSSRRGPWPATLIDFVSDPWRQCHSPLVYNYERKIRGEATGWKENLVYFPSRGSLFSPFQVKE